MNENSDKRVEELMEEFADEMGYDLKDTNTRRRGKASTGKIPRKIVVFGGLGVLLLIILVAVLFSGGNQQSTEDLSTIQARLSQLEERITRLEAVEDKVVFLEKQEKGLQQAVTEANEFGRSLSRQLEALTERLGSSRRAAGSGSAAPTTVATAQPKETSSKGKRHHTVLRGETLYGIAQKYGLSVDELCRLNNISRNQIIRIGQRLVVDSGTGK
jgi:LysM repeat protein